MPASDGPALLGLSLLLVDAAVAAGTFGLVQGIAALRLEGRVSTTLQAAIWDRLLGLPVPVLSQLHRRVT